MLKITVVAALLAGSASVALANLDSDGNGIPGQSGVFARSMPNAWEGAYASEKPSRRQIERDGDGNFVPGSR
jgi:hypothetical protein